MNYRKYIITLSVLLISINVNAEIIETTQITEFNDNGLICKTELVEIEGQSKRVSSANEVIELPTLVTTCKFSDTDDMILANVE